MWNYDSTIMSPIHRRTVLQICLSAFLGGLAGCRRLPSQGDSTPTGQPTTNPASDSTRTATSTTTPRPHSFETPQPNDCEQPSPPQPTPSENTQPEDYPAYPEQLSDTSVEEFALQYETAYQYNWFVSSRADSETSLTSLDISLDEELTERANDGFFVGVEGYREVMDGEAIADNPFVGVYYLTPEYGLRGEIGEPTLWNVESLSSVSVDDVETIFCGSDG